MMLLVTLKMKLLKKNINILLEKTFRYFLLQTV